MNTDPKPGGFFDKLKVTAAELNLLRAGVLNALDVGGGTRTMLAKLILSGTDMFELGGQLLYTSGSVPRGFTLGNARALATAWTIGHLEYATSLTNAADTLVFDLDLPHGNVLDSVTVYFEGPAANAANPQFRPTLKVYRTPVNGGANTQIGTTTTVPYASSAAYKAFQAVSVLTIAEPIDANQQRYSAVLVGEQGTNALAGAHVYPGRAVCTVTRQPRGW